MRFWEKAQKWLREKELMDRRDESCVHFANRRLAMAEEHANNGRKEEANIAIESAKEWYRRAVQEMRWDLSHLLERPLNPSRATVENAIQDLAEAQLALAEIQLCGVQSMNAAMKYAVFAERKCRDTLLALVYEPDLTEEEFQARLAAYRETGE